MNWQMRQEAEENLDMAQIQQLTRELNQIAERIAQDAQNMQDTANSMKEKSNEIKQRAGASQDMDDFAGDLDKSLLLDHHQLVLFFRVKKKLGKNIWILPCAILLTKISRLKLYLNQ
jgi:chromosome segregation ATPase